MPDFAALSEAPGASLQTYMDWKSQARWSAAPAALQYGDLHGIPMMLVLCEKGRMGDTFPQTFRCSCITTIPFLFCLLSTPSGSIQGFPAEPIAVLRLDYVASCCRCLDLRLRTSENFTTFVQV